MYIFCVQSPDENTYYIKYYPSKRVKTKFWPTTAVRDSRVPIFLAN